MSNSTKIIGIGVLVAMGVTYHLQRLATMHFKHHKLMMVTSGAHDFDFLSNKKWKVTNKVLQQRLAGSREWKTFEGTLSDYRKIIDGLGNIDKFQCIRDGSYFEASSIRIYHPGTKLWTIYWVDNLSTKLTYQVAGSFTDGVGTFHGEEIYDGKRVKLRFIWSHITTRTARWEQAYFDDKKQAWEVNWIMEFEEVTE